MWVDSKKAFRLVYALCKHEYLGYLIEPHVVQLNQDNSYSLTYQRIFNATAKEFAAELDETDYVLIDLLESIEQSAIIKRFHKKNIRPAVYFTTIFDEKIFQHIRPKIDNTLVKALKLLRDKPLFRMSKEGWPVSQELQFGLGECSVLFHFRRTDEELRYFPTLKYDGKRLDFMYKDAEMITNYPAYMLMDQVLYFFEPGLETKKLVPFFNKRYISIPRSAEDSYFRRFVIPLIEKHSVYAEGFDIKTLQFEGTPVLQIKQIDDQQARILLHFEYGGYKFHAISEERVTVKMHYDASADLYTFYRIKRSQKWEQSRIEELKALGLELQPALFTEFSVEAGAAQHTLYTEMDWLNAHWDVLTAKGYKVTHLDGQKPYVFGKMELNLDVTEHNDWFDIQAMVTFGDYKIPFVELRQHILNHQREFVLPNGEIALIPETWFSQFTSIFQFSDRKNGIQLKRQYVGLLDELEQGEIAGLSMQRKIQRLSNFTQMEVAEMPKNFHGQLRPYQKAGYDWFLFLNKYRFGGCMADDMGLGKTVQTLALLQQQKEVQKNGQATSLIIVPTSLIYNWQDEAEKFAPELTVLNHTGSSRSKTNEVFADYDIILTTYGTIRVDVEIFKTFLFHYIVLDESQNIKNVSSKSFKAIQELHATHKLILSGTPVENTVADLWSQMSFINPGLLGSHSFFVKNFVIPIERKKDEAKARKLQALIKPFILRRTKSQVAHELPEKTEKVLYCDMTQDQADTYERVKAEFRNLILQQAEKGQLKKSAIQILQGLSKLRQLANHPKMIDPEYESDSGKFEAVIERLEKILLRGHKVLIFSQFVRQMKIYREYFDQQKMKYAYLDGATTNREAVVDYFRSNNDVQVFLISIKAGGVGLNLTEADYVFILDPWWNPAVEMQAIDRSHRIGQTKSVFIYKFIAKGTVEEKILALQKRKKNIADSLIRVEESFVKSLTPEDIRELVE